MCAGCSTSGDISFFFNSLQSFLHKLLSDLRLRFGGCTNVSLITNANHLIIRANPRSWSEHRIILVSIVRNADKCTPDGNERGSRSTAVIDSLHSAIPGNSETFTVAIAGRYIYPFPDSGTSPLMSYWIHNQRESTATRAFAAASRWNVRATGRSHLRNQKWCE